MIRIARTELDRYAVDVADEVERYGGAVAAADRIVIVERPNGAFEFDLQASLPCDPADATAPPVIRLRDVWRADRGGGLELASYAYELLDRPVGYRRALHLHHADAFLRAFGVANHEHCERPFGRAACGHHAGEPVRGAIDGLRRLLGIFVTTAPPECGALRCLG